MTTKVTQQQEQPQAPDGQELVAVALRVPYTAPNAGAVRGALEAVTYRTGWARSEVRWAGMLRIEQNRLREALELAK